MANEAFVQILSELAFLSELNSENPFKIRALDSAARLFEESPPIEELVASGDIKKMQGVGKGTQTMVQEFLASGKVAEHEKLKAKFPPTIFELREVHGLGPKKSKALYEQLGIASLAELEYACEENRLVELKGFGEKTQSNILASIAKIKAHRGKVILAVALEESERMREALGELSGVERVEETGELRRRLEVQSGLDFLLTGDGKKAEAGLRKLGWEKAGDHWAGKTENGLAARAWLADEAGFGSAWVRTTGPAEFVAKLGDLPASAADEPSVFRARKKEFVPPESRDLGVVAKDLVDVPAIRGVFHLHTKWSDGRNTLEEMVEAAVALGYEYLGVSDHSQTAVYAQGLDERRVLEQKREIEKVQAKYPQLRIFHGIESDILGDGALDYPDKFLKQFDFVIGSVHSRMKMERAEMTKRLVRAVSHPSLTWLGHWSGRLLLGRDAYDFDVDAVLDATAKAGKSIELNANPYRLDVDWRVLPRLVERGIPIGIFPDAHSTHGLEDVKYGVWMARKAGVGAAHVVNTLPRKEMERWLEARRG